MRKSLEGVLVDEDVGVYDSSVSPFELCHFAQATTSPSGRRRLRGYHNQSIGKRKKQQATILQQVDWSSLSIDESTGVRRFVQMDNDTSSIYPPIDDLERDRTASCHEGEPFTLSTPQQPLVQRCYRAQGKHTGEYLYASGDHMDSGEVVIAAAQIGGDDPDDVSVTLLDPRRTLFTTVSSVYDLT